jgi:hypothetical protein
MNTATTLNLDRKKEIGRALWLTYITFGWMTIEG